tara:strand:- start:532 stop:642 length:111 start_codon:yes stop_codon:yes gene_type:complete
MTEERENEWIAEVCRTMTDLELLAAILLVATNPAEA